MLCRNARIAQTNYTLHRIRQMAPITRQVAGPVQLRPATAFIRSLMERTA